MPRARGRALVGLCRALADGDVPLDRSADRADVRAPAAGAARASALDRRLRRDAGARRPRRVPAHRHRRAPRAAPARGDDPDGPRRAAERWRPWRSYALMHLWSTLDLGRPAPPLTPTRRRTDMWTIVDSPVGTLRIVAHRDAVTAIEFDGPRPTGLSARGRRSARPRPGRGAAGGGPRRRRPAAGRGGAPARRRTSPATSRSSTCRSPRRARDFQQLGVGPAAADRLRRDRVVRRDRRAGSA